MRKWGYNSKAHYLKSWEEENDVAKQQEEWKSEQDKRVEELRQMYSRIYPLVTKEERAIKQAFDSFKNSHKKEFPERQDEYEYFKKLKEFHLGLLEKELS